MTAVIFGRGERRALVTAFDAGARVLVIATDRRAVFVTAALIREPARWGVEATYSQAPQHVPRAHVERVVALAQAFDADGVLAVGGGSTIGLAKALAAHVGLRKVYVPTTYSGSEMTNIWAVTDGGEKVTARDERVRADLVIYDPDLLDEMPLEMVFPSLFNAMAHAVEASYAANATPEVVADAVEAVRLLSSALGVLADGDDAGAREDALRGACLAGKTLDAAEMGIHHKLAHVLGGSFGLRHAAVHTVLLPYSVAYNRAAAPDAMRRLSDALGGDPVESIVELQRRTLVPRALGALGAREADLERVVDELGRRPYPNPRAFDREALLALLGAAFRGASPEGL